MKTYFLDLDGICFSHMGNQFQKVITGDIEQELLPGVSEFFQKASEQGANIILTTGRPESYREFTEKQLLKHGLWWTQLVMNLKNWKRVLINDTKSDGSISAFSHSLPRDEGLNSIIDFDYNL